MEARTQTFKDWNAGIRRSIWISPGEPKNQVSVHKDAVVLAMIDIAKYVPCVQVKNTSVYPACATFVHCAKSMMELPIGVIHRVYTIANSDWCDQVHYDQVSMNELNGLANKLITNWVAPSNVGLPALPQGIKHAESSTDSKYGRARLGRWAIDRGIRLAIFPWLQSNESLIVEWDGFKTVWADEDIVDLDVWTDDYREAVKTYVRWKHEDQFGCDPAEKIRLKTEYDKQLSDLIIGCERRTKEQIDRPTQATRHATSTEVEDDAVPADSDEINFAIIGDYGVDGATGLGNGSDEALVAALVKSWSNAFVISTGDNNYREDGDYDLAVGKYYQEFIFPYAGAFGTGSATGTNRFWPVPSNHDYEADGLGANTLAKYLAFFTLKGNERYYELVEGPIHFFLLNSDAREPNGNTSTSQQAEWLRAKMLLSTAKWRVVIIHDPPYTSSNNGDAPGILTSRWPFKDWGADVVISGDAHHYERFLVGGLPYLVNGAGGANLVGFTDPVTAGSQLRVQTFGAIKARATCTSLTFEFYDPSGTLLDTFQLTK